MRTLILWLLTIAAAFAVSWLALSLLPDVLGPWKTLLAIAAGLTVVVVAKRLRTRGRRDDAPPAHGAGTSPSAEHVGAFQGRDWLR